MASTMELLEMFANTFAKKVMDVFATKNDIPGVMKGAGSEADGEGGLVPTPHAGNEGKYLRGTVHGRVRRKQIISMWQHRSGMGF